jgi:hypothetical protein
MRKEWFVSALALWFATCATPHQAAKSPEPVAPSAPAPAVACELAKPVPRMWLEFGDKTLDRFEEKTLASSQIQDALNDFVCKIASRSDANALTPAERSLYDATHPDVPARIKSIFLKDLSLTSATAVLWGNCQAPAPPPPANPECALAWEASLQRDGETFKVLELHATEMKPR